MGNPVHTRNAFGPVGNVPQLASTPINLRTTPHLVNSSLVLTSL